MEISFAFLSFFSVLLFYLGTGKDSLFIALFAFWQLAVASIAFAGVFQDHPLLLPGALAITVLLMIFGVRRLKLGKVDIRFLLGIHVLRIPVELGLYQLFTEGKIPMLMTYSGWNFDILVGISALLLLVVLLIRKSLNAILFRLWNFVGILFLVFIVALAVLSAPLPIQSLAFEQPNIAVLEYPYCLLPTCIVPIVFVSHVLLLRKIRFEIPR